jgi:hypothetical protein
VKPVIALCVAVVAGAGCETTYPATTTPAQVIILEPVIEDPPVVEPLEPTFAEPPIDQRFATPPPGAVPVQHVVPITRVAPRPPPPPHHDPCPACGMG